MKLTTAQINEIVGRAYSALDILNNIDWTKYRERCFDMACEEERGHRRGAPNNQRWSKGASVNNAARMFVCIRIAQALTKDNGKGGVLTLKDLLHTQPSAVYAASIVENYGAQILTAWNAAQVDIAQIADLDYCDFVGNE